MAGVSLLVMAFSTIPYLVGYLVQGDGLHFAGVVFNLEDYRTYIAKMWLGYRGEWQYHSLFTPEEHPGAYVYSFYILLGHLARWLQLPLPLVYHLARLGIGWGTLLVIYQAAAWFTHGRTRRLAFLIAATSSGMGWLINLLPVALSGEKGAIDFWLVDANTFFSLLTFPHFAAAIALLLAYFMVWLPREGNRWLAIPLGWGLGLIHPYMLLPANLVPGLYLLWQAAARRHFYWRPFLLLGAAGMAQAPVALYSLYVFSAIPHYRLWLAQGVMLSPPPLNYLLGYGLVALLAIWGLPLARRHHPRYAFLLLWVLATFVLAYLPHNAQRRFVEGVHVALSFLAAYGLAYGLLPWLSTPLRWLSAWLHYPVRKLRWLVKMVSLLLLALSTVYLVASHTLAAAYRPDFLFYTADEAAALRWLAEHTTWQDTVLASYDTGNLIGGEIGHRVVLGHWAETINAREKTAQVRLFYDATTSAAAREQMLGEWGVAYIFLGRYERQLGDFDPGLSREFRLVFQQGEVALYAMAGE